jgi:AcrR family transcriptional regulator
VAPSRAEQAEQARSKILTAAVALFSERGYDSTSLAVIAEAVGMTKAHVYHYFPTKAAILEAALAPLYAATEELLDSASAVRNRSERLDLLVDGYVELLLEHRRLNALTANDPAMRREKGFHAALGDLNARALHVLFGEHPSLGQRLAFLQLRGLGSLVEELAPASDDELRATLAQTCRRLLATRVT